MKITQTITWCIIIAFDITMPALWLYLELKT